MIHLVNLTKSFGDGNVLENISLHISPGDRIGLIGPNGAGKTTLFKIITGELQCDKGEVHKKKNISIGYLPQELKLSSSNTVINEVMSSQRFIDKITAEIKEIEKEISVTETGDPYHRMLLEKYGRLREKIDTHNQEKEKLKTINILNGLGFKESELDLQINIFSRGWQMKIAIARLLMEDHDLLLLDEPTNHLDISSIEWLENYLKDFPGTLLIISHDKYLLNNLTDKLVEIDNNRITVFFGDYDHYLNKKEKIITDRQKKYELQQQEIERIKRFIERNRVRKDRAKMVQSRIKYLEKLEPEEAPVFSDNVSFRFPETDKSGKIAYQLKKICHNYDGRKVLENIDLTVGRGEKIALIGANGSGKTTILKIISKILKPNKGDVIPGFKTRMLSFIDEDIVFTRSSNTVFEEMEQNSSAADFPQLRNILGAFLFTGDDIFKKVNILSGGEKCRLALARMMVKPSNFLILDEPTSHLDVSTQTILEKALRDFTGTVIFVSHDRAFIDNIATKVIEIEGGKIKTFFGNYTYYLEKRIDLVKKKDLEPQKEKSRKKIEFDKQKKREEAEKRTEIYSIQKQINAIEKLIHEKENRKNILSDVLGYSGLYKDGDSAKEKVEEFKQINEDLEKLYSDWEKLISSLPG